jgi:hypothetical protein
MDDRAAIWTLLDVSNRAWLEGVPAEGQEIVVLVRSRDQWHAIWRTQLPAPGTP